MKFLSSIVIASLPMMALSFCPTETTTFRKSSNILSSSATDNEDGVVSREKFMKTSGLVAGGLLSTYFTGSPEPVFARGRATLEQSYVRYVPRITAGGEFYGGELKKMVVSNDWEGIKDATSEPPPKNKSDRSKVDGGVAARAKKAGQFSESRVLNACDLFAGAFSDNSISPKTKKMQEESEIMHSVVQEMNLVARQALGEVGGGGFFGFGAKKPDEKELSKKMRELYTKGGQAYNQYVFEANDDLALIFDRLPFLS